MFQVSNSAIVKDATWIPDIAAIFDSNFKQHKFVSEYCARNPSTDLADLRETITALLQIKNNPLGIIELDSSPDIEIVTEIFIRVNLAGVPLRQADFAVSKIAVNDTYGGPDLRKAVEYFCHLAVAPRFAVSSSL